MALPVPSPDQVPTLGHFFILLEDKGLDFPHGEIVQLDSEGYRKYRRPYSLGSVQYIDASSAVAPLTKEECRVLDGIKSAAERYTVYSTPGKLAWGVGLKRGDIVQVKEPAGSDYVIATIRWCGTTTENITGRYCFKVKTLGSDSEMCRTVDLAQIRPADENDDHTIDLAHRTIDLSPMRPADEYDDWLSDSTSYIPYLSPQVNWQQEEEKTLDEMDRGINDTTGPIMMALDDSKEVILKSVQGDPREIYRVQEELREKKAIIDRVQVELRKKEAIIEKVQGELREKAREKDRVQQELREKEATIDRVQVELREKEAIIDKELREKARVKDSVQVELREKEAIINKLQGELREAREKARLQEVVREKEVTTDRVQREKAEENKEHVTMEQFQEEIRDKARLQKEVREKEATINKQARETTKLLEELKKATINRLQATGPNSKSIIQSIAMPFTIAIALIAISFVLPHILSLSLGGHPLWDLSMDSEASTSPSCQAVDGDSDEAIEIRHMQLLEYMDAGETKQLRLFELIAGKWEKLAIQFNYDVEKIRKGQSGQAEDHCRVVLDMWLEKGAPGYPTSWNSLVKVIEDIELFRTAKKLKKALKCLIVL